MKHTCFLVYKRYKASYVESPYHALKNDILCPENDLYTLHISTLSFCVIAESANKGVPENCLENHWFVISDKSTFIIPYIYYIS